MDHLAIAHDIVKDANHPSIVSKQTAQARQDRKQRALDAGMTEARFQAICSTRYIIRKLLPFSHIECPEFRATVHAAWKVIKAETQRNLVAEMYLLMVSDIKKILAAVIATALLPPFWINVDTTIQGLRSEVLRPHQRSRQAGHWYADDESRGHRCVVGGSQVAITVSVCCLPTRDRGCGEQWSN
jgi:hypothetical protein